MAEELLVFVVDDDPIILDVLASVLGESSRVETFGSGRECLERTAAQTPDLFLLDVSMPEIDGYALCRQLKEDWSTQDVPVLFLSASDDVETRLACYEAGGDDFIRKPFNPDELLSKLEVSRRLLADKRALREQAGYAQRTAMSAMASMGELGVVLQFLSRSFACRTLEELARGLLDAIGQYDLHGAVQLRLDGQVLSLSPNGHDLPLEVSVLNHVREAGRIFQFRSRCVFNYGEVTLLINDMPLDDAERCGRIRDNAALLAEGAEARRQALAAESLAQQRRQGIEAALPDLQKTLDAVQDNYRRNCYELTQLMVEFEETLAKSFINLGLTESQEEELTAMASGFMRRMVGTQDQALGIVDQLRELAQRLGRLVGR